MPVMFAVPRIAGWLAHWKQQLEGETANKISRPRQLYIGEGLRDYVGVSDREDKGEPSDSKYGLKEIPVCIVTL